MKRPNTPLSIAVGCSGLGVLFGFVLGAPPTVPDVMPDVSFSFWAIFLHNALIALVLAAGGVFLGGPTILVLVLSGIPLGVGIRTGIDPLFILPHAVFEFPAIWLAGAAGLLVPRQLLHAIRYPGTDRPSIGSRILALTTISLVLLAVAAAIEVFLTPRLVGV